MTRHDRAGLTTGVDCPSVQEAGNPGQGTGREGGLCVRSASFAAAARCVVLEAVICVCRQSPVWGPRPIRGPPSFTLNYLLTGPISKYSHQWGHTAFNL